MEPHLRQVNPRSLGDHVVESLREAILEGVYAPGEKLVERQVAEALGVSTIALREAFVRLAEEGLIVRVPRRGAWVAPMTAESVRDLTRIRIVLEQLAAELAIDNWSDREHQRAQEIVDQIARAGVDAGSRRLFELDEAFHRIFWEASGSETLLEVLVRLRGRLARYLRQAWVDVTSEGIPAIVDVHRAWLDAVESGDVEHVKTIVANHITASSEGIVARLTQQRGSLDGVHREHT